MRPGHPRGHRQDCVGVRGSSADASGATGTLVGPVGATSAWGGHLGNRSGLKSLEVYLTSGGRYMTTPCRTSEDAVKQGVAEDKVPRSNRLTAALIAELPEPVQGLLVHAYRAILRGAQMPEPWREAIIWQPFKGQ